MHRHIHHPRGYFADAPTLAAPENLGRSAGSHTAGAESRETSGVSGAATLSPAGQPTAAGQDSPHGNTGASPELAKPAPADDAAVGRQGIISRALHAAGVGHRAYAVAADRISHAQQLRAARTIFGRR